MRGLLLLSLCLPLVSACHVNPVTQAGWFRKTEIGDVGGGVDSVSLWLAILGLALAPVTAVAGALVYQHILRPRRIVKENGNHVGRNE